MKAFSYLMLFSLLLMTGCAMLLGEPDVLGPDGAVITPGAKGLLPGLSEAYAGAGGPWGAAVHGGVTLASIIANFFQRKKRGDDGVKTAELFERIIDSPDIKKALTDKQLEKAIMRYSAPFFTKNSKYSEWLKKGFEKMKEYGNSR